MGIKALSLFAVLGLISFLSTAKQGNQIEYQLIPNQTRAIVQLGKSGLLGFMGDEHTIEVPVTQGRLITDPANQKPLSLEFVVETDAIRVLDPHLKEETRDKVRVTMAGESVLDVVSHPEIRFSSQEIKPMDQENARHITGNLRIKEETVPIEFTAAIVLENSQFTAHGEKKISTESFGNRAPIRRKRHHQGGGRFHGYI